MEPERIELSHPERERLKVLHEVEPDHWPQVEAAQRRMKRPHVAQQLIASVAERPAIPSAVGAHLLDS